MNRIRPYARSTALVATLALAACAAPTYRVQTSLPPAGDAAPVAVVDLRPAELRMRRQVVDLDGRELPAHVLGDADIAPAKTALLAYYLAQERRDGEPQELEVDRLDVLLWYPTASGSGFSFGYGGSHGAVGVAGFSPQPVLGDAVVVKVDGRLGGTPVHVELREPLGQGVTRYTREPTRPDQVRPAFERAARAIYEDWRHSTGSAP